MDITYEWLYENYAGNLQEKLAKYEETAIDQILSSAALTGKARLQLVDFLADHRFRCGVESFALGVQLGLRLTMDFWRELPESTVS